MRHEWKFQYETPILFAAAQAKRQHHDERATWWADQFVEADKKLRATGMEFRDVDAGSMGKRTEMVIDPQLKSRVDECRAKVREHGQRRDEYQRWENVLAKAGQAYLELTADDVTYFGVADGDVSTAAVS